MKTVVNLYSENSNEIKRFLSCYYGKDIKFENNLKWEYSYENPIDVTEIIGVFIENNDKFKINMWISLDPEVFINVNDNNADKIIRYLYERYPY